MRDLVYVMVKQGEHEDCFLIARWVTEDAEELEKAVRKRYPNYTEYHVKTR